MIISYDDHRTHKPPEGWEFAGGGEESVPLFFEDLSAELYILARVPQPSHAMGGLLAKLTAVPLGIALVNFFADNQEVLHVVNLGA